MATGNSDINELQDPSAASMAGGGMDRHNASPDIGVDPDDYRVAHLYHNYFASSSDTSLFLFK